LNCRTTLLPKLRDYLEDGPAAVANIEDEIGKLPA
jgi:hypothetical protein